MPENKDCTDDIFLNRKLATVESQPGEGTESMH